MPQPSDRTMPGAPKPAAPSSAELSEFETIAAAVTPNAALSTALEAFGREVALGARSVFETAGETTRGLLGARTWEDVVRLQSDFARRSFEGFVERSAKLSELGCSLLGAGVGAWAQRAKG